MAKLLLKRGADTQAQGGNNGNRPYEMAEGELRALLGGPRGGWCAPCGGACRSGLPSMLLQVRASDRRSGRGPDVFCLDFNKLRDAPAAQLELDAR